MGAPQAQLTLADIARLAGVSSGTASRALNDAYGVAPATRQRVLDIARERSYVISPAASSLARGITGRVAVVVPHLARWFFSEITEGVAERLCDAGLDVVLYPMGDPEGRHRFFETLPARRKVDAVVVVAFPVEEHERARLELMGVHVVAAGGQQAAYPFVSIDDVVAARQAVDHLVALGHRRIAMVESIDPDQPTLRLGRSTGYDDALRAAGINLDPGLVVSVPWGGEEGAAAAECLLALAERPTAIYTQSDEVAVGVLRTLHRAGLRVPEDMSVVGIDDHAIAELVDLTTVRQPVREQGHAAADMLVGLLRGQVVGETAVYVPTRLVIRRSTGPPGRGTRST